MNRTGLKVRQKHAMIFHEEYPYLFADVDGIVTDERGRNVSLKQRQRVSIRRTSGKWCTRGICIAGTALPGGMRHE